MVDTLNCVGAKIQKMDDKTYIQAVMPTAHKAVVKTTKLRCNFHNILITDALLSLQIANLSPSANL